ncbi:hypothetical protein [Thiopseudomonas alkaliphila]|uniref:hypothetical protein n=1 Tax=Thiopseudomonas alkaliphila TaxID=1697053 RepID=UPI0025788738|nr:hypothetical protein [Thiopseudomonas alkaliphila]MDM1715567.1 hypothetical protein [Thiopseudomonas alkaliphila]MDM1715573.1 hypothetical protein [Thiopseudomonas alkaliphila]
MIQLIMIIKGLLHIIAIPLYFTWFYFIYYMIFKDFKTGLMFFIANIVVGYLILFINKGLSSYQIRLIAYQGCETEEEKAEVRKALKDANL